MALGIVSGVMGAAQGIGGLFGGGGPRQPRMNRAQKQYLKSQANMNNTMAQMMRMMMSMMQRMQQGMMGRGCGHPQGGCCQQGMNGANCCGGPGFNNGFPGNPMGNMFGGGPNININIGGGPQFARPPMLGASFAAGVSMYA